MVVYCVLLQKPEASSDCVCSTDVSEGYCIVQPLGLTNVPPGTKMIELAVVSTFDVRVIDARAANAMLRGGCVCVCAIVCARVCAERRVEDNKQFDRCLRVRAFR